ncbi:sigma-54 interaction domain-containing protein [Desulforhopalus singaporensis]|uniref:PAS domain S-box-containing protein n=1 Tax=Desulforhopalus singaporensis TaxID=91360 RepID=A0A1H0KJ81_9BACT|nr:sigma 54-interacting transcriptional regulator [Desulforhopalus singaporensis]SDO55782.1 PAS domain S-box-containing protein [Desulforhopalus singaporensis]
MSHTRHEKLNHQFISRIIDSMADGVFTLDKGGRIASWNRSMEKISGYSAAEALGQTCALLNCSRCFGTSCPADIGRCRIFEKGSSGAKECQLQHKNGHDVPVIKHASVVRGDDGEILGVVETVTDISELNRARRMAEEASLRLGEIHRLDNIIGKSEPMVQAFESVRVAAASDVSVLIQGESGTGKELIAGAIHYNSDRRSGPLVTVNCSALPETLLESELFGHVKGAYTGAIRSRTGRFEEAADGTVFLDEIGELSPFIQVKLLRVLQEREIERIGESQKRKINIRIVTATHQDLRSLVAEGKFREDLYYRLNVFPIKVPSLRERKEDIPLLTSHFIQMMNRKTGKQIVDASREVMRIFMDYRWPGNVRELENALEHSFVLCNRDRIEKEDLPEQLRSGEGRNATNESASLRPAGYRRRKVSKDQLLTLLVDCSWNKSEVARRLGLSHTSVWKYMKKWGIPLAKSDPRTPPVQDKQPGS